jgi:3'-5' exoribonuclease
MPTPAPAPIVRLSELTPGQRGTFFALLIQKKRGERRDGTPFIHCQFRDHRRTVTFPCWFETPHYAACDTDWQPGQFFKIHARYTVDERYGPQIEVGKIRLVAEADEVDGFRAKDFLNQSRFDPEEMFVELVALVGEIVDEPLRLLTLGLLEANRERLLYLPGSRGHYYNFSGGWLEHTLSVTRHARDLAERYVKQFATSQPPINRDLVVAAAALHEIGRIADMANSVVIDLPEQTVDGALFGHVLLGRDMVREAARTQENLNPELLSLLEHLLLTHLSRPEWGLGTLPIIPEGLILHYADDLDAKMEMVMRRLQKEAPGPFTERDPVLGRSFLKSRSV